jgi:hypothetical protein
MRAYVEQHIDQPGTEKVEQRQRPQRAL